MTGSSAARLKLATHDTAENAKTASRGSAAAARKSDKVDADWQRFTVDVWLTNFNSAEFGLYKHARNKAKSRQFSSDMDIFAEVIENGDRTGLIGYREDLWTKTSGMERRLVFKLFSESLNWRATMDMMTGRSLALTLGARGLPVVAFSINTADDEFMVYLERSANKWPLLPENFSFFLVGGGQASFYRLKRRLIDLGGDYALQDQTGAVVGLLDGKVFSVGGKWKGKVKAGPNARRLQAVLQLFAGFMIFNAECRRHMRTLYKAVKAGRMTPHIDRQEADLYLNPRRGR